MTPSWTALLLVLAGILAVIAALVLAVRAGLRRLVRRARRLVSVRVDQLTATGSVRPRLTVGRPAGAGPALPAAVHGWARHPAAAVHLWAVLPGPGRAIARVRRELALDVRGARRAVTAGRDAGRPVQGLQSVLARLTEQARALDVDLAVIGNEPDRLARQRLLGAQAERLTLLRRACAEVRRAVLLAGSVSTQGLLRSMENDLNDEVIALALRARAYVELTGQ